MSFQWNHSGPGRQVGHQTQPMSHWSNQEQYNPGNQYGLQETGATSNDWTTGVPYQQWCPPTSQEQMNWACTSYSSSHYNQPMPNNFTSDVYSRYPHSKPNFGDNFTGLYDEPERNNVFDYPMTNSFMSGQGNDNYRMPQNSFLNNCQEPAKVGRTHNANNNFPYWDQGRNESESMNYMPHFLFSPHASDSMSSSSIPMKTDLDSNHRQEELMQTFDEKPERTQYGHISKPDLTSSRFSNSPPSDFFMGIMSHDNIPPSNISPIQNDGNTEKFYNTLCPIGSIAKANSSLVTSRYSQATSKGNFRFDNNQQSRLDMIDFLKKDTPLPSCENFLQEETLNLRERALHESNDFKRMSQNFDQNDFGKSYKEIYHLSGQPVGMKVPQSGTTENIEGDLKWDAVGHNVPSYIDFTGHREEYGFTGKDKYVPPWKDEPEPSIKSQCVKSFQQNPHKLKTPPPQNFNNATKSENSARKVKKAEEQTDSNVPSKNSPAKKVRRAVLKYLLKQSSHIEKCFGELRHVKKMLKDNPTDKEVIKILSRVEMQINQSRLSLKEKKKVCAKSNIRLRSLTIKSTGTNILQTLESDMYHLRRFYSALSHIARHLGTIEKPPQESQDSSATPTESFSYNPSHSQSSDESSNTDVTSPKDPLHESSSNIREKYLNGPPQKSARFMYLERRFWDKLMEMSYLIRSKILALRQAERAYKNGKKESLAELKTIIETPRGGLKRDYKLLIHWKKRYNFSRHIPSYILQKYPEQERRSRDKITLKSVRKNLATFMSLCYSTNVLIRSSKVSLNNQNVNSNNSININSNAEEVKFWKRLVVLYQKIQMYHSELSKLQLALTANHQDQKNLDSLIRIEARVKEIDSEIQKEEMFKQKNGFRDVMPDNAEIQRFKLNCAGCKNFLVLRESLQNMKTVLSEVKALQLSAVAPPIPNVSAAHTSCVNNIPNPKQRITPVQILSKELPSDLAQFLGDGPTGWI